jgi:hypothetical protein
MVWTFVQISDGVEAYAGQTDEEEKIAFLPIFIDKENAEACMPSMPRAPGVTLEAQAVRYREISADAARNGFLLFVLDGEGRILDKLAPVDRPLS